MSRPRSRADRLREARAATPPALVSVEDTLPTRARPPRATRASAPAPNDPPALLELRRVPLRLLRESPLAARVTDPDQDIEPLARHIAEHGLLENLGGVDEGDGHHGVTSGIRRLRALQRNADLGVMSWDEPVPLLVKAPVDAREASLAAHVHRVALNPADELDAFRRIAADHPEATDPATFIARRLSLGERHVAQRLRLARLAPPILDALRAGAIGLDAARAYASVDDREMQQATFDSEERRQHGPKHQPRWIREALARRTYRATCKQALYVGLDAYRAAGGRVDQVDSDLFEGTDAGEQLLDPAIIDRLATEKANEELTDRVDRDGFGGGQLAIGFTFEPIWPRPARGCDLRLDPDAVPLHERADGIGLYFLRNDGAGLELRGWWRPRVPAPEPEAGPATAARDEVAPRVERLRAEISGEAAAEERRRARVQLLAARLCASDRLSSSWSGEEFVWPETMSQILPAVYVAPREDDMILVSVQVRVPRAAWEAAMPAAEEQLEEEQVHNDRVAQAEGEAIDG